MTWDDDKRAAAFVSTKDPAVLKFSKNVTSYVKDKASKAINKNFLTALALFESLKLYGMSYAVDPTSPFTERSKSKTAVDYLQFPPQTLNYKAGDCDDLSILYAALLESLGVRRPSSPCPAISTWPCRSTSRPSRRRRSSSARPTSSTARTRPGCPWK